MPMNPVAHSTKIERAEWDNAPLSAVYSIKYGKANPRRPGKIPVIGSSGVYAWTDTPLATYPTIVIGRKGSAGQVWLIEEPSYPSDTTFYLEPLEPERTDIRFAYFALKHSQISASDDVIPSLQRHKLETCVLRFPPLPEQQAIAAVLSKIQTAVEVQDKLVATLKELKAATMAKLFREGLRDGRLKQTEIGEIPESWVVVRLGELSELITKGSSPNWQGFDYSESGVLFIRSQNIGLGELLLSDTVYLPEAFNRKERRSILRSGDVLINIVGASIGRAAVADSRLNGANINQAVAVVRLTPDNLNPFFLMSFLLSRAGLNQMHRQKKEIARANLSLEDVGSFLVPMPSRTEQDEIATVLESVGRRLVAVERRRDSLKSLFSSMLHLLMTGQVRVTHPIPGHGKGRAGAAFHPKGAAMNQKPRLGTTVSAELLQEIVRRIVEAVQPEKIILFGSAARGEMGPDSDVDLLVVKAQRHRRETAQRLYQALAGIGVPKDIVVVTPDDLERHRDSIGSVIYPALREGKVIYAA